MSGANLAYSYSQQLGGIDGSYATVGPEIYARVTELVTGGKSRTEAFAEVAKERKSSPGTVAANFYRVARQQGQARRRPAAARSLRTTQQRRRGRGALADGDLRQTVQQITELMEKLVSQVEERDRKLRELLG